MDTSISAGPLDTSLPTGPESPTSGVKILEMNDVFEDVEGEFRFTGTHLVYQDGKHIYHAASKARHSASSEINMDHFTNKILIPTAAYSPPVSPAFTRAPDPLPCNTHVKRPRLISYGDLCQGPLPSCIADGVLAEVQICERLTRNPHPNIARYLGCQVSGGRIDGICFVRYGQTLMQAVNPGSLNKRMLSATRQGIGNYGHVLDGVEGGLRHLHSLGLVHNDINPSNVMMDRDTTVIIDFGSCCREGESLDAIGRTYEWFDEAVRTALPSNDLDALKEIRIWLEGGHPDEFQFKERW